MAVKISDRQYELGSFMAKSNARTRALCNQLGLHKLAAKRLYKEVTGKTPPSGLSPDSELVTFGAINRFQASLLLQCYEKALDRIVADKLLHAKVNEYELLMGNIDDNSTFSEKSKIIAKCASIFSPKDYEAAKIKVYLDKAHAFIASFNFYNRVCEDDARIDINRFDFIIRHAYQTVALKEQKKIINWCACKTCGKKLLKQWHEAKFECPHCSSGLTKSKNLLNGFRQRAIRRTNLH